MPPWVLASEQTSCGGNYRTASRELVCELCIFNEIIDSLSSNFWLVVMTYNTVPLKGKLTVSIRSSKLEKWEVLEYS